MDYMPKPNDAVIEMIKGGEHPIRVVEVVFVLEDEEDGQTTALTYDQMRDMLTKRCSGIACDYYADEDEAA